MLLLTNVLVIQTITRGFPGAPGYTSHCFAQNPVDSDAQPDAQAAAVRAFWGNLIGQFPTPWTFQVQAEAKMHDEVTGELLEYVTLPSASTGVISGTGGSDFGAGVAGACISWSTNTIGTTRRIRGRTFLVPLKAAAYDSTGTLTTASIDAIMSATTTLDFVTSHGFGIWRRPVAGAGGKFGIQTGTHVTDRAAYLRTRRT